MRSQPSPAVLILLGAGISSKELAAKLDLTPQAVSLQLAGRTQSYATRGLLRLLRSGYGDDLADQVAAAIDNSRTEINRYRNGATQ